MRATLCIGHRGARGHLPENTLPSFEKAISLGADWIELDVYNVEGELVVIHDKTVDRTTNGSGKVADFSLAKLRRLDAGDGAVIPTLREVLDLVGGRCGINVELKGPDTAVAASGLLDEACTSGWQQDQFLVSSFDHVELARASQYYARGALFGRRVQDEWERAERLGAWSVNYDLKDVSESLVAEAHQRGYRLLVYTVNAPEDIQHMLDIGVDGIFSDYPDRVINAMA